MSTWAALFRPRWPGEPVAYPRLLGVPAAVLWATYVLASEVLAIVNLAWSSCLQLAFTPFTRSRGCAAVEARIGRAPRIFLGLATLSLYGVADRVGRGPLERWEILLVIPAAWVLLRLHDVASSALALEGVGTGSTLADVRRDVDRSRPLSWYSRRIRHADDAIWIRSMLGTTMALLPPTAALFLPTLDARVTWVWYLSAIQSRHLVVLADHLFGHFRTFAPGKSAAIVDRIVLRGTELYFQFVANYLIGHVPYLTKTAHNVFHHGENNGPDDFESTYPYDRSSFLGCCPLYLNCMLSYAFGLDIFGYLVKHGRRRHIAPVLVGLAYSYGLIALGALVNWRAAVFLLCVRLLFIGRSLGGHAYTSHALIDPDDPLDSYKNSVDFAAEGVAEMASQAHIMHHRSAGAHWTRWPALREKHRGAYEDHRAIILTREGYKNLQPLMFAKRFDLLSRCVIDPRSLANDAAARPCQVARPDVIALLERRSRPAASVAQGAVRAAIDRAIAAVLLMSVPRSILFPREAKDG